LTSTPLELPMTPNDPSEVKPGWGRGVIIHGEAEVLIVETPPVAPDWFSNRIIRIHPRLSTAGISIRITLTAKPGLSHRDCPGGRLIPGMESARNSCQYP